MLRPRICRCRTLSWHSACDSLQEAVARRATLSPLLAAASSAGLELQQGKQEG